MRQSRFGAFRTARVLDALATRVGLGCVLAALVVTCIWAGSSVERSIRQLQEDHAIFQDQQLRNGFQSMSDMKRLVLIAQEAAAKEGFDDTLRTRFASAADILFVRTENFSRILDSTVFASPAEDTILTLRNIVDMADTALADDAPDVQQLLQDLLDASDDARRSLVLFLDDVERMQRAVLDEQSRAVAEQRSIVQASLAALTVIGVAALLLLRREVVARHARERAERNVEFLAYFDALTELPNRTQFLSRLSASLEASEPIALAFVDLDDFKGINDTYGHATGDAVLKKVASLLSDASKSHDGFAARLGGDEFAVILPDMRQERLLEVCQAMIEASKQGMHRNGETVAFGLSIGLATSKQLGEEFALDMDNFCRVTDFALYASKEGGRGRCTLYDTVLEQRFIERKRMIEDLPVAMSQGDLIVYLQPKVELPDRTVYGFEGLIRWHRSGSIVSPENFISVAEESGLIVQVDRFMLDACTHLISKHNDTFGTQYSISVNLSAIHFTSSRIVDWVRETLAASALDASLLTLEITETVEMRDWRQAKRVIGELRSLGVRVAIDDFGTGYSSLGYLRSTSADELKIDKSLVDQIETSEKARFLLDGVLDMAQNLELDVVVEGIETEEQEQAITKMGAHRAQGYLYGAPNPAEEVLRHWRYSGLKSA